MELAPNPHHSGGS